MEKVKVVIYVEGGNVQAVYAGDFVDVEVIDFDNMEAEGRCRAVREGILADARGDLLQQY
jgi:hypothetical protein